MHYRKAVKEDIEALCRIRKQQLIDEGIEPNADIDEPLHRYFSEKFSEGSLVEWLLEDEGEIVATAAIVFMMFPPSYTNRTGMKGYITNMYTHPHYRKRGIATAMLKKLEEEAKSRGVCKLWLGASKVGRPVYQSFGFVDTGVWLDYEVAE